MKENQLLSLILNRSARVIAVSKKKILIKHLISIVYFIFLQFSYNLTPAK